MRNIKTSKNQCGTTTDAKGRLWVQRYYGQRDVITPVNQSRAFRVAYHVTISMAGGRKKQTAGGEKPSEESFFTDDYFVYPHLIWIILVPFGLYLLFVSVERSLCFSITLR
ncbi:hypothetical protein BaRGS_00039667 [Batillaria attramentaria]|uniref:Uncharacterized protein n=1 Tax=Batillaria attramentaria TaxID=370345 RepID=A0ABD0J2B3_9CAEN